MIKKIIDSDFVLNIRSDYICNAQNQNGAILEMENIKTITPNQIEIDCKTNRENLSAAWKKVHGTNPKFPKRHVEIPRELLIPFLVELQNPSRADDINAGATQLLLAVRMPGGNGEVAAHAISRANIEAKKPNPVLPEIPAKPIPPILPSKCPPVDHVKSDSKPNWFVSKIEMIGDWNGYTWTTIIATGAVVYGLVLYLDAIGILIGALYGLALIEAVRAARNPKSQNEKDWAIFAVLVLELFSGFVHFAWLDFKLWERASRLPFHFTSDRIIRNASGKIIERISENATPGTIGVVLATIISGLSIYAIWQQMNRTTDKILAE